MEEFQRRRRDSGLRAVAAQYLLRYAGQSQREVARLLKAGSGSAISKQISRYREGFPGVPSRVLSCLDRRRRQARR